jgi:hypothetical protein
VQGSLFRLISRRFFFSFFFETASRLATDKRELPALSSLLIDYSLNTFCAGLVVALSELNYSPAGRPCMLCVAVEHTTACLS